MVITMSRALYQELIQYCCSKLPEEACGMITGLPSEVGFTAISLIPISNIAQNPQQNFEMNPSEWVPILYKKDPTAKLIGIFHSHPSTEALPSQKDLHTLWYSFPTYWIVSFQEKANPFLQIFEIKKAPLTSACKLSFEIDQ
jgi:proteasome lid subunit RPN8/RPN11